MEQLTKELEFICEKCHRAHEAKYGKTEHACAFQSFDNEYCPEVENLVKLVQAESEGREMPICQLRGMPKMNKDYQNMSTAERIRWWAENCDRCNNGCQVKGLLEKAARELDEREAQEKEKNSKT